MVYIFLKCTDYYIKLLDDNDDNLEKWSFYTVQADP